MEKKTDISYEKKIEFVEKLSLLYEEQGHPRISGQILGWLHVCDPPEQSFSELVEHLQVSKASVSNMTRMLMQAGLIKKVRKQGERQVYFTLAENMWCNAMEKRLESLFSMRELSAQYLEDEDPNNNRIADMHEFHDCAAQNMFELVKQHKKQEQP